VSSVVFLLSSKRGNQIYLPHLFFRSAYSFSGNLNQISIAGLTEKSKIFIDGENNKVVINKASIRNTLISVTGKNNQIICEDNVQLNNATLIVRGTNCKIQIGASSNFGGIRIVNVGFNNDVSIGKHCVFADFIEIWASDTHSIYNEDGNFINPEQPITIGNNVWVGSHATILKGVDIGDGAVIGMNTTVTKNILPRSLNVGYPARCIKENIKWTLQYEHE
jgi:acetyltransferase-like isoleucine patch superfamily enzyme